MTTLKDLEITYDKPNWCPGCGDFGVWISLKNAIVSLNLNPWEVVLVSGIGCSSKLPYWVKTYGFNGLHGRPMPVAEGIKLANQGLTVIVIGGDGDQYGEGANHLIHAARRNIDLTVMVHNNQIYGLTTGQFSPTTDIGENKQETQLITEGVKHKGFAIIDTMQPCVTFNHKNTFSWFYERVYKLEEEGHDPLNRIKAFERAEEWPLRKVLEQNQKERIPTGIFYKEDRSTWEDATLQIQKAPLVKQSMENRDITPLLRELM